jgi:hypothetical protein
LLKPLHIVLAAASLMLFAAPAIAQMAADHPMAPDQAMGHADHAMAPMKPMSARDKKMMMACHKMAPARAAKSARCAKLMKAHPDNAMDHAM